MLKFIKPITALAAFLIASLLTQLAYAQAEHFVDAASAKGIAEIESARMALKESQNPDVQRFAQQMVDDHTQIRQELAQLAQKNNVQLSDDAALMDQAKLLILQLREGENFDQAYAENQINMHEQTIELYRSYAAQGQDQSLQQFAKQTLPTLEQHLQQAQQLASSVGAEPQGQPQQSQPEQGEEMREEREDVQQQREEQREEMR